MWDNVLVASMRAFERKHCVQRNEWVHSTRSHACDVGSEPVTFAGCGTEGRDDDDRDPERADVDSLALGYLSDVHTTSAWFASGLFLISSGAFACGGGGGVVDGACTTSAECGDGICIDGRCRERITSDAGSDARDADGRLDTNIMRATLTGVAVEPAMSDLIIAPGEMATVDFELVASFDDGSTRPVTAATFTVDDVRAGLVDEGNGVYTTNGAAGGSATLTANTDIDGMALSATAMIRVQIQQEIVGPGVPSDVADRFETTVADETRQAQLVYPLEGALMPQNVFPADLQWLRGVDGDLFHIALIKPNARLDAYLVHGGPEFGNHWLVDQTAWEILARTDPADPLIMEVDRWDAATDEAIDGDPVTITFASAALTGSVYYWDIAAGRILRIDDGTADAVPFMPNPPGAVDPTSRCVGCHSVSNSGRYMVGRLGGGQNIAAVFDLTGDLTGDPPPTEYPLVRTAPTSAQWWFSTWSPDDTRLATTIGESGSSGGTLQLVDPFSGAVLAWSGVVPGQLTHPAWSPDGTQIAYAGNVNGWGGVLTAGDIATVDVTGPDALGENRVIHAGASLAGAPEGGIANSYPTWTPDSSRIAFGHGTGARSEDQQGSLYIMNRDGSSVTRLDTANSAGHDDFQPRFSPFDEGGYFWLSFLSRRDYGNAEVGTRGRAFQQVWVTAIRKDAPAGSDPSSVPYWVPGQRTNTRNISAYWAPRPCREDGDACSVGSECCGGDCRPGADGALVCSPPPPDRCRDVGETCSTSADCCDELSCSGRVCLRPPT